METPAVIFVTITSEQIRLNYIEQNLSKPLLMKVLLFLLFVFALFNLTCTRSHDNQIVTLQLSRSDYIERIDVTGTVQAVINIPVVPPRSMFGQMTVVRLAADGAFVNKGDTICVLTVPELESMARGLMTSIETLEAGLKKTEADNSLEIALLEAQVATSEAQLRIAMLDSLRMTYATDVQQRLLTLGIQKALIEKQKTEKKLTATRMIGETEIRQAKARIMQEKARAQSMADQVSAMTIIAQHDGIVMRTESPTFYIMSSAGMGKMGGPIKEGSVLFLGTPVLQFPDLTKMQVSAEVTEADFRVIEKGQKVNITVDAAKKLLTTGSINRKSLIGRTAQRYSDVKVKFYEVIIDIDSCHSEMKPGLSADCEILLKEAKDTIFVPTLAIFDRDSVKVVYVREGDNFIPVEVVTGLSGSSHTIISDGLKGDEIIALSEPPFNRIKLK
jgi:multidrug resistance efflux pump